MFLTYTFNRNKCPHGNSSTYLIKKSKKSTSSNHQSNFHFSQKHRMNSPDLKWKHYIIVDEAGNFIYLNGDICNSIIVISYPQFSAISIPNEKWNKNTPERQGHIHPQDGPLIINERHKKALTLSPLSPLLVTPWQHLQTPSKGPRNGIPGHRVHGHDPPSCQPPTWNSSHALPQ